MAKSSGGGGHGGRSGGGGGPQADAGQPGEVFRAANLINDKTFDKSAVVSAIKEGALSRDELSRHIDHTKYGINAARKEMDNRLANRGSNKASDVRATSEFKKLVNYRDRLKGQLDDMYRAMKETTGIKKVVGSQLIRF